MHDMNDPFGDQAQDFGAGSPPTSPSDVLEYHEPPAWPKVIGIISIVLGSLGLFCGGAGLVTSALSGSMGLNEMSRTPPELLPGPIDYAVMGLALVVSIILLAAGIATVMRKVVGRHLHLAYGLLKLVHVAAAAVFGFMKMQAFMNNPDADPQMVAMMGPGLWIGMAFNLLYLIWPIFCLIWFGAVKKTEEDFTGGAPPRAA